MRTPLAALAALLTLALAAGPAAAITSGGGAWGGDDNGEHPYVGQMIFYVPDAPSSIYPDEPGGWFSCTGTVVEDTVVLTAGHCTFAIGHDGDSTTTEGDRFTAKDGNGSGGNDVWISFNEDDDHWDDFLPTFDANGDLIYPTNRARYEARAAALDASSFWQRATSYPHPLYDDRAFYIHDLGVIVLDDAFGGPHGAVAGEDYLNKYAGRRNDHRFEVVGYGLNKVLAAGAIQLGGDTRMKAEVKLNNLVSNPKDTYIQLSNNARTGGTCFGDSGGPTFDTTTSNLVVAVTSFGLSPNCTGIGGAYRVDQPDDLDFLADHGVFPAD
jgi:hypothetical protein